MSWTDERIETLRKMWEGGQTATQIAEQLGFADVQHIARYFRSAKAMSPLAFRWISIR